MFFFLFNLLKNLAGLFQTGWSFHCQVFPDHELAMVVVGTIKGNGSGVIKPVTRFTPAHNFIICGARSLFTKDVNTILPGYFVVFGSQQAMRCENFIPSFLLLCPQFSFTFQIILCLIIWPALVRFLRCLSLQKSVPWLPYSWFLIRYITVRNEFGHHLHIQKQLRNQMLILIWHWPTFSGRTSSSFCFRKPPLHFHHRPVLTH